MSQNIFLGGGGGIVGPARSHLVSALPTEYRLTILSVLSVPQWVEPSAQLLYLRVAHRDLARLKLAPGCKSNLHRGLGRIAL